MEKILLLHTMTDEAILHQKWIENAFLLQTQLNIAIIIMIAVINVIRF